MYREIQIPASTPYTVTVGTDLLPQAGQRMQSVISACTAVLVADDTVGRLYGDQAAQSLANAGYQVLRFSFPHGEQSKNLSVLSSLLEFLAEHTLTRTDVLVALGGGVTGDLTGFAAAVYLRGIRFVQIPTTLLAAVDASVGGKTAVDLQAGKNLCGAFHQPAMVLCDCSTFQTLPDTTFGDGIAEAIKYGILTDADLFRQFETSTVKTNLTDMVARCVEIKRDYVAADEFDNGVRQFLNLGHTPAHAIERLTGYRISHGYAVAIGMAIMARAAQRLQLAAEPIAQRIQTLLRQYHLPTETEFSAAELAAAALGDKKRRGDQLTLVVPKAIGHCILKTVSISELANIFSAGMEAM